MDRAHNDMERYNDDNDNARVITEDEISDYNGPGAGGSPYVQHTIVGYGGRNPDGYSTMFYCVVKWFDGVTNGWDGEDKDSTSDSKWVPRYE